LRIRAAVATDPWDAIVLTGDPKNIRPIFIRSESRVETRHGKETKEESLWKNHVRKIGGRLKEMAILKPGKQHFAVFITSTSMKSPFLPACLFMLLVGSLDVVTAASFVPPRGAGFRWSSKKPSLSNVRSTISNVS
jgi:hypothetical protein